MLTGCARCRHPLDAHEHYRGGRECSTCATCPAYVEPAPRSRRERLADLAFAISAAVSLWRQIGRPR